MKKILAGVLALSLIVGIGGIAQAKNYNFSRVLPKLQNWGDVAKGVKRTSKKASINFSVIASDYKINVGHWKGNTQVSAKAYNLKKMTEVILLLILVRKKRRLKQEHKRLIGQ
ncbi:hypothetical protein QUF57_06150 [Bacillus pumilus]|uniref:hypothetical protein n=1 Tax=Bacillus pumilus TaxID=1408 RepID=UPI0025A2211A|nr:hypothetical protein [Bacillus pumilus]MDM5319547.1 hypothetical protein [Bacillus pumilus]